MLMHKNIFHLFLAFSLLTNVLLTSHAHQLPVAPKLTKAISVSTESSFQHKATQVIDDWLDQIGSDNEFIAFKTASWTISALGPGTHSHLVTLYADMKKEEVIGYLVLHTAPTGALYIGEYGKGHFDSLHSVSKRPSTITYYQPFEVVYSESDEYIDLFTSEAYPISEQIAHYEKQAFKQPLHEEAQLLQHPTYSQSISKPYFSPYDSLVWLFSPSINEELETDRAVDTEIEFGNMLYYRTKAWQNKITTIYAITALHTWNDNQFYIGLQLDDEDSIRFIPYFQLLELGDFYSSSSDL